MLRVQLCAFTPMVHTRVIPFSFEIGEAQVVVQLRGRHLVLVDFDGLLEGDDRLFELPQLVESDTEVEETLLSCSLRGLGFQVNQPLQVRLGQVGELAPATASLNAGLTFPQE